MVVNLLLSGTREHTYRPPRVTFALYRLFSLLLILELIFCSFWISLLCTVNGMPMKHPQNYIHLQKVNCLCFIFLIRFLCVLFAFAFIRFGYFIVGMRVLHTFSDLYSFASFLFCTRRKRYSPSPPSNRSKHTWKCYPRNDELPNVPWINTRWSEM